MIELLIAIGILAIIGGVLALNVGRIYQEQRFRTGLEQVIDRLQVAQNLMFIINSDVIVSIYKGENNEYIMKIEVEKPIPKHLRNELSKAVSLKGIEEIVFDGEMRPEGIHLKYSYLSHQSPEGILTLKSPAMEKSIPLYGYPHPITIETKKNHLLESNESANLYPIQVRDNWQKHLESKQKKEEDIPAS